MSSEKDIVAGEKMFCAVRKVNRFKDVVNNFGILIQNCSDLYTVFYDTRSNSGHSLTQYAIMEV